MTDFNTFGVPSKEWLDFETEYGPVATAAVDVLSPEEIQHLTNEAREQVSADQMKLEGTCIHISTEYPVNHNRGLDDKITIQTFSIPTRDGSSLPTRIYRSKAHQTTTTPLPVYLFYHGGGFILGSLSSEDAGCSRIAAALPIIVINVCYRHTPQVRYPVPWHDAFDSFDWVVSHLHDLGGDPERLIVGGISAGANLAAAVVLRNGTLPDGKSVKIRAQMLFIPWLFINPAYLHDAGGMEAPDASRVSCKDAPVLPGKMLDYFVNLLRIGDGGDVEVCLPDARLCESESVKRTPPTVVAVAGRDPLRDDGLVYAQYLHRAG